MGKDPHSKTQPLRYSHKSMWHVSIVLVSFPIHPMKDNQHVRVVHDMQRWIRTQTVNQNVKHDVKILTKKQIIKNLRNNLKDAPLLHFDMVSNNTILAIVWWTQN